MKTLTFSFSIFFLICLSNKIIAQDISFTQLNYTNVWYNPSYIDDQKNSVLATFRQSSALNTLFYSTGSLLANIHLKNLSKSEKAGYFKINGGLLYDKSAAEVLTNFSGVLGIGYVLPVSKKDFVSVAFQGSWFQSTINFSKASFPGGYNDYGPIPGAALSGLPSVSSSGYSYFGLATGLTYTHDGPKSYWYVGGSVKNFNRPEATLFSSNVYVVPLTYGGQLGYIFRFRNENELAFRAVLNSKSNAYEHIGLISYKKGFTSSSSKNKGSIGFTGGMRYDVSVIAGIDVGYNSTSFAFFYDFDIKNTATNFTSFEVGLRQHF